ncbi:MAG: ABC transporter permease subunit [Clostridiales bacterium]|jgi:ABC-2 type transport system permease protein|nr:ABC transporter permease subunit [Clostridiales bacterium]
MISRPLFKQGFLSNGKILLIFAAVLTLYFSLIVSMFDPKIGGTLQSFSDAMPEVMAMFGMNAATATLTGFLANYLYGFLMLIFPLIFTIMASTRLIARHVDRGSMACLLAAPRCRRAVALTQALVLIVSQTALILYCTLLGIGCSASMFPGELDVGAFLSLNAGVWALHMAIAGFCFFASCISDDTRRSFALGAGVPIAFYLIQMLANMGGKLENLQYFTLFTLFDTAGLMDGTAAAWWKAAFLLGIGVLFFIAGIRLFERRDLPL